MFEMMLTSGTNKILPVIPDNGPGPSTLRQYDPGSGDGYFGLTTISDLFTVEQLEAVAATPLPGSATNRGVQDLWGKYTIDGKIIYIPKVTVRSGVSWANLYSAGFLYGTNDNGLYAFTTDGSFQTIPLTPVNQQRLLTKTAGDGTVFTFKIRAIKVMASNPNANISVPAQVSPSEYARTIERTSPTLGSTLVWANNGLPSGGILGLETRGASGGLEVYNIIANGNNNALWRGYNTKQIVQQWLPVVELVSVVKP